MGKDIQTNLLKWIHQPTGTSGFEIPYDFEVDIQTTLYPEVVIGALGAWQEREVMSNVVNIPRGKRFNESDLTQVTLGQALNLQYVSGEYDNVFLDHQLAIGKIFQNFEIESTGAQYVTFFIEEAMKEFARVYENYCVIDLVQKGTDGNGFVVAGDIYKTLLGLRAQLVKNGSNIQNVDLYVTPDVVNAIMNDSHYISNGQCETQAYEVRNGFMGRILGFNIYESGRYAGMEPVMKEGAAVVSNILAVDNTQVRKYRHMVQPLTMERAPSNYVDCSILKAMEYFKNYVINSNGVYYINFN